MFYSILFLTIFSLFFSECKSEGEYRYDKCLFDFRKPKVYNYHLNNDTMNFCRCKFDIEENKKKKHWKSRIYEGLLAEQHELGFTGCLYIKQNWVTKEVKRFDTFCTVSIINERFFLTAAHW